MTAQGMHLLILQTASLSSVAGQSAGMLASVVLSLHMRALRVCGMGGWLLCCVVCSRAGSWLRVTSVDMRQPGLNPIV
jgi:hypothetical protein